jgi:Holliday junction resolvase RusA-like endonuclease
MITRDHAFLVLGTPVQQGDMTCYGTKGRHRLVHSNADALEEWRGRVEAAARKWVPEQADKHQAIDVGITWSLLRPAGHWGTGRNADTLKPSAPRYPTTALDVDKLTRAVLDALQASKRLHNDAQVIDPTPRKRYASTRADYVIPGARPDFDDVLPCPGVVVRIYPKD